MQLSFNISINLNVEYYQRNTDLTDQEIADMVYKYVKDERDILAQEARYAAMCLLDGEDLPVCY